MAGWPEDLKMAAEDLLASDESLVVVAGERILLRGNGPGIKPILEAIDVLGEGMIGSAVADRVVGKAAALFLVDAGVGSVFGEVLSDHARQHLEDAGLRVESEKMVPHIVNRAGDGPCPLEKIAVENDDPAQAMTRIRQFLSALP
ncbi:MAG: DUF1893 domain-containing protein [Clostridia bacterium]